MAEQGQGPLAAEPVLYPDVVPVWEAFWRLTGSRSVGMGGIGGIPFDAIDRYATRYGVDDFELFHRLLVAMDAAFLERVNRR